MYSGSTTSSSTTTSAASFVGGGIPERSYIQSGSTMAMVVGPVKSQGYATLARDLIIGGHRPKDHPFIFALPLP